MSEPTRDAFAIYVESAHHSEGDAAFLREMLAEFDALTHRAEAAEAERGADTGSNCVICTTRIYGKMIGAGDGTGQNFAHPECYYRTRVEKAEAERDALRSALRDVEWVMPLSNSSESCSLCGNMRHWGHAEGCYFLDAALAVQP